MTDVVKAVQVLVEDPRLSGYFHIGHAGRTGVQVVDAASALGVTSTQELTSGVTVAPGGDAVEAGRIALYVDSVKRDGSDLSIAWRLPDEGLSGRAVLRQSAGKGWMIETLQLAER